MAVSIVTTHRLAGRRQPRCLEAFLRQTRTLTRSGGTTIVSCAGKISGRPFHPQLENPATMRDSSTCDGETRTRTGDTTIFSRAVVSLERRGNAANLRLRRGQAHVCKLRKFHGFLADSGDEGRLVSESGTRLPSSRPVAATLVGSAGLWSGRSRVRKDPSFRERIASERRGAWLGGPGRGAMSTERNRDDR